MANRDAGRRSTKPARADGSEVGSRSARKRRLIMEAATTAFLRNGYLGTSMDEIAALAGVSKQTVYKHFADKQRLFTDIILATSDQVVGELVEHAASALPQTGDVEKDLGQLARQLIAAICQPEVLRLRRLADRGLLQLEDPQLAAHQFAGMVLWVPVNRVMFCGEDAALTPAEIDRYANAGARAFLDAHGRP
jgi:TetR/AcrR family transcriptional repressor of mexJK operon